MTVRGYQVAFDWSRAGLFTNVSEDVSSYVTKAKHVTVSWGRNDARATSDSGAGKMDVDLINTDRRFSPENPGSPIVGKILPNTPARLNVTHPVSGSTATLFSGPLDDLSVNPNNAEKTFAATVLDGWGVPGSEALSTPVYSGKRTGELVEIVLDAIGWTGPREIDPGATVVPYWWEEGTDAATAMKKIVDSEGPPAIAYVRGGTFVFRDRMHRLFADEVTTTIIGGSPFLVRSSRLRGGFSLRGSSSTSSTTSSYGVFTHIKPAGSGPDDDFKIARDSFSYDHGLKNISNAAVFQVDRRVPTDIAVVWSTESPISLGASETSTLIAQTDDPFLYAITPVDGTDYTLAAGTLAVSLSRTSGQSVFITLTAGAGGALLSTGLTLRAVPLTVANTVQVQAEDTSSIGVYRRQKWPGTVPWAGPGDALAIARRIVAVYATARPTVVFRFTASPSMDAETYSRYLAMALLLDVSVRITVRNDEILLDADFMVERVVHDIQQLGLIHVVELHCQIVDPVQPENIFTFNVAGKGFDLGHFATDGLDSSETMFLFDTAGHGFDQGVFAT